MIIVHPQTKWHLASLLYLKTGVPTYLENCVSIRVLLRIFLLQTLFWLKSSKNTEHVG
jgi:hypothetical protein